MKNLRKERKVIVEKVNHYSVHLEHDSLYHTVKTEEQASTLKKQIEEQERKKVKECNNQELRDIEANRILRRGIEEEMQKLVTTQRTSANNEERAKMAKQLRARLKELIVFATEQADEKVGYYGAD